MCGNEITIADYFGAGPLTVGELIGIKFDQYPNLARWVDNDESVAFLEYGSCAVQ